MTICSLISVRRRLIAALFAGLLTACALLPGTDVQSNGPESYGLSAVALDQYWDSAVSLGLDWRPDAYVREVTIDVQLPNSPASSSDARFKIESPSEDLISIGVFCSAGDCEALDFEQGPGSPITHCKGIDPSEAQVSSQEALEIGLAQGGRQYIYGSNALVSLTLSRTHGNKLCTDELTWIVSFFEPETRGIDVDVDAVTGDVLD